MEHARKLSHSEEEWYNSRADEWLRNGVEIQNLFWDFQIHTLDEKDDTPVHFCDKCELPIKIYGQMIPCKHAFCYACAVLHGKEGNVSRLYCFLWSELRSLHKVLSSCAELFKDAREHICLRLRGSCQPSPQESRMLCCLCLT